ncbi:MAG: S41 family peptidase [Oscillospiraceae bacterium]|nr:S41 family peptidase [Oscillospiraceae bacterium]
MKNKNKKYIFIILILFCIIIAEPFISLRLGNKVILNKNQYQSIKNISDKYLRQERVIKKLKRNFLYEVDDKKLKEESLRGAIYGFDDPYTVYFSKKEFEDFWQSVNNTMVGIGVTVNPDYNNNLLFINDVVSSSPALEAGLKPNDQIIEIDGKPIDLKKNSFEEIVGSIRGEEGTEVKLKILRENKPLEFKITRREIKLPNLYSKQLDDVGYIRLLGFEAHAGSDFKSAIEQFKSNNIKKLILDLRDNPGGLLDEAQAISDLFLAPNTVITYLKDNKNNKDYIKASSKTTPVNLPIVLIVNQNSASAAELFTGMMKDYKLATVIGTTTYGKGVVQSTVPFSDGSAVKLTTAEYFTPKGHKVNDCGVKPDIEMTKEINKQLEQNIEIDLSSSLSNISEDVCVKKALEILNK